MTHKVNVGLLILFAPMLIVLGSLFVAVAVLLFIFNYYGANDETTMESECVGHTGPGIDGTQGKFYDDLYD